MNCHRSPDMTSESTYGRKKNVLNRTAPLKLLLHIINAHKSASGLVEDWVGKQFYKVLDSLEFHGAKAVPFEKAEICCPEDREYYKEREQYCCWCQQQY